MTEPRVEPLRVSWWVAIPAGDYEAFHEAASDEWRRMQQDASRMAWPVEARSRFELTLH